MSEIDYISSITTALNYIFDDIKENTPLSHCIERDKTRLFALSETRGLPTFTLDLPSLGKHFDKCLSYGAYVKGGLDLSRSINSKTTIPRLFSGLLLRVFHLDGTLRDKPCIYSIKSLRQIYYIGQKVKIECTPERTKSAYDEFIDTDDALPDPDLDWASEANFDQTEVRKLSFTNYPRDPSLLPLEDIRMLGCLDRVMGILMQLIGEFNPIEHKPKHGPGAVSDKSSKEFKYNFEHWSTRLDSIFPLADFAYANYSHWADEIEEDPVCYFEHSSKMVTVPKTQKGPRLIAAEPTSHMWCQQSLRRFLETRVAETGLKNMIQFKDQTFNQRGALEASKDSLSWTVDLSAASDRLSLRFAERAFKSNLTVLNALRASRTLFVHQDICPDQPAYRKIRKLFTMGNACTFPVQTIAFTAIAIASCLIAEGKYLPSSSREFWKYSGNIRVFGDDIIIPAHSGEYLVRLMELLSFKINDAKTHTSGYFRESCGMDAYYGVNVTPARIRKPFKATGPESLVTSIATANNFFMKGYTVLARHMRSYNRNDIPVIGYSSGQIGYIDYTRNTSLLRRRFRNGQPEIQVLSFTTKVEIEKVQSMAAVLQFFIESPDTMVSWSSEADSPRNGTTGIRLQPTLKTKRRWVPSFLLD